MIRSLRLPASEQAALVAWASTFYPFQQRWLFDASLQSICNKARQIGLSHTSAAIGVFWGAYLGELTTIISIGDRESVEVLDKARLHAEMLRALGSRMALIGTRNKANELTFASGGRILALPASAGRGYTGNVFLDEYAYQENAERVWDAAAAATSHRGFKLRVVSTPNGVGNVFHNTWLKGAELGFEKHEITIDQAEAEGFPVDHRKCWSLARGDRRLYDQLYRCSFIDSEFQYIPNALLEQAATREHPPHDGETFAGLDVGRTANLTALVITRVLDGVTWVLTVEVRKRTSQEDLDELVALAVGLGARRVCVDATGMGAFPAEALQKRYGRTVVEPVTFTSQVKEDLATTMYQYFAEQRLRLPETDADMARDIASIRRVVTTAGNVRYDAPNTAEGHADRAWALALAIHAQARPSARRVEVHDYDDADEYDP